MGTYILRRLLWTVVLLFFVTALTFLIFNVLPTADPAKLRAGRNQTPETVAAIRDQLNLDDPFLTRFFSYLGDLLFHFDFGTSVLNDEPVRPLIFEALPNTLMLVLGAAVVWFVIGVVIGTISAVKRGSILDRVAMTTALVAISAPVYWLGLVALYLFSSDLGVLGLFPAAGTYDASRGVFTSISSLFLPWLVLAAAFSAIYARLLRSNLLETMSEDYIRTARAKGLKERTVVFKHGLRSAITPIITVLGLDIGILLGGAILTESVFGIPGIGRLSFDAIQRNDIDIVQGATLFLALGVCTMSLLVDVLYAFLDPRVRY
ncbi:MAG: transporter permease [Solirubrobacterales bacterium]|jgi:peptide/nickel transport system permease protein|nr:transporter permease [Solirubrobacterales bacterium]